MSKETFLNTSVGRKRCKKCGYPLEPGPCMCDLLKKVKKGETLWGSYPDCCDWYQDRKGRWRKR